MKLIKSHQSHGGTVAFWMHASNATQTDMAFSTFIPKCGAANIKGCLIWLSGLTCTEENAMMKMGAQVYLAQHDMMMICPDTSPRGLNLPHEHDSYDFGSGAGFYVNATTDGYKNHYQMRDYIVQNVVSLLRDDFNVTAPLSISGHSMGGHGALTIGLAYPEQFVSISAFAPIVQPTESDWGKKAFAGYLGDGVEKWQTYDACALIGEGFKHPHAILIDQGLADDFYPHQLNTPAFETVCTRAGQAVEVNYRAGYDHSYYFINSFIEQHIAFHAKAQQRTA